MISIIIPALNEEKYIEKCIYSFLETTTKEEIEIIVVDGNSNDKTRDVVKKISNNDKRVMLIDNAEKTTPFALNKGIEISKGEYIAIAGAHAEYENNYLDVLLEIIKKTKADCVGAQCITIGKENDQVAEAIRIVLSDKLGVGNSSFRIGVKENIEVDTVAYGFYKKDVFKKYGLFDTRLIRNQDIEFNKRIVNNGGKIILTPDTYFLYNARNTYGELAKNNFSNGKWVIYTAIILKNVKSESMRHFIPMTFIIFENALMAILLISKKINITIIFLLMVYYFVILIKSILIKKNNKTSTFKILIAYITLHFSYGIGSLFGLINYFLGKKLK